MSIFSSVNRLTLCGMALGAVGCSQPAETSSEQLRAQASSFTLTLQNLGSTTVYTFVVEREYAARINWAPCADPTHCTGLEPGASTALPFSQIGGYSAGAREAVVYHWHLIPQGGVFLPDTIRALVVTLQ